MGIPAVAVDNSSSDPVCESSSENINVTDSMGSLFGQALSEEQDKQNESAGNFIYSVEISDGKAVADYITNEGDLLTVAIYDEEGIQLITSVQAKAEIDTTKMEIPVDKSVMPEYFYIRAFLTDEETLRPLCTVYESPNYTRKMQEFFAKTVDDFEEEKVVNFDNSADNNFAVYSEDTRVIEDDGIHNQLTENNEEEKRYVFSNTDEKISSLSQGNVISYETEGNTVIIKVDTIEQNDSEVVITGQDTSSEMQDPSVSGSPGYPVDGEVWIKDGVVSNAEKRSVMVTYTAEDGTVLANAFSYTNYPYEKVNDDLLNNSILEKTTVRVNEAITVKAKPYGGIAPYTYAYYYRRSTNTKWNAIGTEFGTDTFFIPE